MYTSTIRGTAERTNGHILSWSIIWPPVSDNAPLCQLSNTNKLSIETITMYHIFTLTYSTLYTITTTTQHQLHTDGGFPDKHQLSGKFGSHLVAFLHLISNRTSGDNRFLMQILKTFTNNYVHRRQILLKAISAQLCTNFIHSWSTVSWRNGRHNLRACSLMSVNLGTTH